jgi:hypothetical protein
MPLHRLLPAALLCLLAFAAMAEEPTTAAPESSAPAAAGPADEAAPASETEAVPEGEAPEAAAPAAPETADEAAAPETEPPSGVIEMPQEGAPPERPSVDIHMPVKGMTMAEVETTFGAPQTKLPAVGKPPITRWVYADYTVYFEYSEVIHTVLNQTRPSQP